MYSKLINKIITILAIISFLGIQIIPAVSMAAEEINQNIATNEENVKFNATLNGTGSYKQHEMLKKTPFKELILALDPDPAGIKGTEKIKAALESTKIISELNIPEGKDVNDLTYDEFTKLTVKDDFWFL